jgi:hypothetical protein
LDTTHLTNSTYPDVEQLGSLGWQGALDGM